MLPLKVIRVMLGLITLVMVGAASPNPQTKTTAHAELAANIQNVELAGHVGGIANSIVTQSNYAYASIGDELAIIDISRAVSYGI